MPLNDLLPELLKLDHDEMVQAIEILKTRIADEEPHSEHRARYEVWSPMITPQTAAVLQEVLRKDKKRTYKRGARISILSAPRHRQPRKTSGAVVRSSTIEAAR